MENSRQPIETQILQMPPVFMSANWSSEDQMYRLFVAGLEQGVRGFDTAREYRVERKIGRALRMALESTGIPREKVWIQSRISNEDIIKGNIQEEVECSLDNMSLDYFDCYMFHWPTPDYYINSWNKLVDVKMGGGMLKSIGMCNCRMRHLNKMEETKVKLMPDIIQVEVTPFWQINDLNEYCNTRGIKIQAFSPLCKMIEPIRNNAVLQEISIKHNVSIPQVILRWHIQRGIAPISMSTKIERIKENFNVFSIELDNNDMEKISELDCGYKYHLESTTCYGF